MNLVNKLLGRYSNHPEAVIISCFFNPLNSPYRTKAFNHFLKSIKHLNYRITECVIGDGKRQLPDDPNIDVIHTENLLWHKEALLNRIVARLPKKFKYIFWVDADVIFTNKNWLVDGVKALQTASIIQPFEYCVHMEKDELKPSFDLVCAKANVYNISTRDMRVWRSFCANHATHGNNVSGHNNYDVHGHVGFAWGARRSVLDTVPLYDKALIGGADHIIAHAAAGHIPHRCIEKSFTEDITEVTFWSRRFQRVIKNIGYVKGDLYHIWHGDIKKRDYLQRIKDFTPVAKTITKKDKNGMYITKSGKDERYMQDYFRRREVSNTHVHNHNNTFTDSLLYGYATDSAILGTVMGGNPAGAIIGESLRHSTQDSTPVSQPECQHDCHAPHSHNHHHDSHCPPDSSSISSGESSNFS